ncbi:MAG: beta-glucosidase family protein [Acidimicrobiales bacterium]
MLTVGASPFSSAAERVARGADGRAEAAALVRQMTLAERLGCLDGDTDFWPGLMDMVSGGAKDHPWPAAVVARLGIPGIQFADGPRGCTVGRATCFPVSMARGATFDPELEERIGEVIGRELRAIGATYTGAVCMNLLRHPGWGRAQETYGEDPCLVGEMAAGLTRGLQRHVMACMKHFALNSIEEARFRVDVTVDERALHEVYLPHFRRVAAEGVASVMSAYNSVNGHWCGENRVLLTDILREEWGWEGFVISDFIAGLRDPVVSVKAGLDIEMPFRQQRDQYLGTALGDGTLLESDVDARVVEILATLLRYAWVFDNQPEISILASPEHRALAREAAARSMVLLRNESELLPVEAGAIRRLAVLGGLAAVANLGDGGSSNVDPPSVVTLLEGIREAFVDTEVAHSETDPGIARGADLAVVVVGFTKADEGEFIDSSADISELFPPPPDVALPRPERRRRRPEEGGGAAAEPRGYASGGDRRSLRLHTEDELLIAATVAVCPRTVVAVMGGSATVMPWLDDVPATLLVWYPGMEGGRAFADVLTGASEPQGRLPFAIPREESQLVTFDPDADSATYDLFHGQWKLDRDGVEPHRPFGAGLGYARLEVVGAELAASTDSIDGWTGSVLVQVANATKRTGSTVIQVYGSRPASAYERPVRRLVGFRRVEVSAGRTTNMRVPYDLGSLAIREHGNWTHETGHWQLTVGQHAHDAAVVIDLELEARPR